MLQMAHPHNRPTKPQDPNTPKLPSIRNLGARVCRAVSELEILYTKGKPPLSEGPADRAAKTQWALGVLLGGACGIAHSLVAGE